MQNLLRSSQTALLLIATTLPLGILSGCGTTSGPGPTVRAAEPDVANDPPRAARYNDAGELIRPEDHREWIFVGAPVTPNDMNDGQAAFPEFHNVYIDPISYASFRETGEFPNGTMIVKELVSVGGKRMPSGAGYFQGEFVSLEAMVKDTEQFSDEPGGWAFFRFGEAPDYDPTGARMRTVDCNGCHAGATQDYVFTATYPVLRAARANVETR